MTVSITASLWASRRASSCCIARRSQTPRRCDARLASLTLSCLHHRKALDLQINPRKHSYLTSKAAQVEGLGGPCLSSLSHQGSPLMQPPPGVATAPVREAPPHVALARHGSLPMADRMLGLPPSGSVFNEYTGRQSEQLLSPFPTAAALVAETLPFLSSAVMPKLCCSDDEHDRQRAAIQAGMMLTSLTAVQVSEGLCASVKYALQTLLARSLLRSLTA